MITTAQQEILQKLRSLLELAPDVRAGQLMAHLGVLCEDAIEKNLWDVEDEELLRVVDRHIEELQQRHSHVA